MIDSKIETRLDVLDNSSVILEKKIEKLDYVFCGNCESFSSFSYLRNDYDLMGRKLCEKYICSSCGESSDFNRTQLYNQINKIDMFYNSRKIKMG